MNAVDLVKPTVLAGPRHSAKHGIVLPVLLTLAIIGAVELALQFACKPSFWQKTTYLLHDPYRGEPFDRSEVYVRLGRLADTDPEIISVGDSSGFFSLQSNIVGAYAGRRFLSLNTGANHAFAGYRAVAEYMLRRSPHLKTVVLYMYPNLIPSEAAFEAADLAPILADDLVGAKSVLTPPSAFLAPYAKALAFDHARFRFGPDAILASHAPQLELGETVGFDDGWLPEFDKRFDRVNGRSPLLPDARAAWFDRLFSDPSTLNATLSDFDAAVRRYGARLVIAFQPVGGRSMVPGDPHLAEAEAALTRFGREHPDVKVLFPLITRWSGEKFGQFNHVSREYAFLTSERLGRALRRFLDDPDAIPPYRPGHAEAAAYPDVTVTPTGPSDPALRDAAFALFRYGTLAGGNDRRLISRRVLDLLDRSDAFGRMMGINAARNAVLARKGVERGYDLSGMRAVPVDVAGLTTCGAGPTTQWVHVFGTIGFGIRSPTRAAVEPVSWPEGADVLIPTVLEDGVRKFDGYCPEPP